MSVGAEFDLHVALGSFHERMGLMEQRLEKLISGLQEDYATLGAHGATSTTLRTTIDVGMIPAGRVYDLRLLTIAPSPVTTDVACDVYLFVGSPSGGAVASQYRDRTLAGGNIPVTWGPEGRGAFPIRGGDHLYLVLGTTAAATDVSVTAVFGDNADR